MVDYNNPNDIPVVDYDLSKVPEAIRVRAEGIEKARYGKQNKAFLKQSVEIAGVIAQEALETASYDGNSLADVTLAKDGLPTLDARIRRDVNNLENKKADKSETTAQLAQTTHESRRKRELEDLSPTVLSAIEGGYGTSFNLLSKPQNDSVTSQTIVDNAVGIDEASFIKSSGRTSVDIDYYDGLSIIVSDNITTQHSGAIGFKGVEIPLENNSWYQIKKNKTDRFRVVLLNESVALTPGYGFIPLERLIMNDSEETELTFYNENFNFAVVLYTSSSEEVDIMATKYDQPELSNIAVNSNARTFLGESGHLGSNLNGEVINFDFERLKINIPSNLPLVVRDRRYLFEEQEIEMGNLNSNGTVAVYYDVIEGTFGRTTFGGEAGANYPEAVTENSVLVATYIIANGLASAIGQYAINGIRNDVGDDREKANIKSSGFPFPNDLIAFWDFSENSAPYYAKAGVDKFPLKAGGSIPNKTDMKPFGTGLKFNGSSDYLIIDSDEVGALNVAKSGDEVTVIAWVKRPEGTLDRNGFIAGMWQEDHSDPKRQYGLFTHLPVYGGWNRVCGHVSKTGGPSPNIPWSRDYSTSARMIGHDVVRNIAMVYDGDYVTSYIDGYADSVTDYKEPNSPDGEGLTYDKNPYKFDLGLNRFSLSDFTVGAVSFDSGMGNYFNAELGGLAVFRRALTAEEIMKIHLDSLSFGDPIQTYDFYCNPNINNVPLGDYGWFVTGGDTVQDHTNTVDSWIVANSLSNYFASLINKSGLNIFETNEFSNIRMTQLNKVSLKMNGSNSLNSIKFCIKLNDKWYATSEDYHDIDGGVAHDWTGALTHNIPISREPSNWLELNYNKGTQLSLGTIPTEKLPNGEIQSWGILANEMVNDSRIRLTDIKFYSN